ncbi:MFS transporter [Pseudonocardia yunnanensis]|uniref:MFS transporter n=1 Tax=Pseudonocardia yunnanensis TaxID=58107 RepID=A0ABW4ET44_9PSEU
MTPSDEGSDEGTAGLAAYRTVLALPGVAALTAVSFLARIAPSAATITLTLHVVLTLGHGYAAAGLVGAASTIGMAVGAPLLGRLVDRRGLRTMLSLTLCAEAVFWTVAPWLSYPALLVGAFLGGLLGMPVYSVVRQSLAAMVPARHRRPAFALDSMSVEMSYIIGPAVGTLLALQLSTSTAMWIVGAGWVASGIALWLLNPPTRAPETSDAARPGSVREWLDLRLLGALLATTAAVVLIFGTEISMIAGLQTSGQAAAIAVVNAVWCIASLTGGFLYGAARRSPSLFVLVAAMGVATLLVAAAGPWWSYALLLVPAGLLCAPSLAASSEAVSGLAPEHARGLVTGLHGSAITVGAAISTPVAGLLIDVGSPAVAVITVGFAGIAVAGVAALLARRGVRLRRQNVPPVASIEVGPSVGSQPI